MLSIRILNNTFVRQLSDKDCGLACLAMILRYKGKGEYFDPITKLKVGAAGLSLFEMKEIAHEFGLKSQCVELDISYLDKISVPIIIHTVSITGVAHFMVCFGTRKVGLERLYLIGDPAQGVILMSRKDLENCWITKAALYFPELSFHGRKNVFWSDLVNYLSLFEGSRALMLIVPSLSTATIFFGIALAWILQETSRGNGQGSKVILLCWVLLLVFLCISRTIVIYIKQQILVHLTTITGNRLNSALIDHVFFLQQGNISLSESAFKNALQDLQKITKSGLGLTSVFLPDLFLFFPITAGSAYLMPTSAILNIAFSAIQGLLVWKKTAALGPLLNNLTIAAKSFELGFSEALTSKASEINTTVIGDDREWHAEKYQKISREAHGFGLFTNRSSLSIDLINTVYLTIIFLLSIVQLQRAQLSARDMVTIVAGGFYLATIPGRLFSILPQIESGINACRHLLYMRR